VPSLDGANVVIGRVTAGLDVVAAVARTPTFAPLPSARTWNSLAAALGDGRAAKARASTRARTRASLHSRGGNAGARRVEQAEAGGGHHRVRPAAAVSR
jgi:cyclophilin family peptidyl-prolyl cis-trans isomerase